MYCIVYKIVILSIQIPFTTFMYNVTKMLLLSVVLLWETGNWFANFIRYFT